MRGILRGRADRRQLDAAGTRTLRRRLQSLAFSLLYGPGALGYDRFTDWLFLGEWRQWQDAALPFLPTTGAILEIGSGTGAMAARAASDERIWCCLEPSPPMIAVARRRVDGRRSWLVRGDARAVPFASVGFTGAVATFPAPYILAPETHRELARVVAPGGVLAVVLTGQLAPDGARRAWRCRLLDVFYGRAGDGRAERSVDLEIPGFAGTVREVPTRHGRALVYVGIRSTTE